MKVAQVKDNKFYQSEDGTSFLKKSEAMDHNVHLAKVQAIKELFVKNFSLEEMNNITLDMTVEFLAAFSEEFVQAMEDEDDK